MNQNRPSFGKHRVSKFFNMLPAALMASVLVAADLAGTAPFKSFIGEAQARIGRPWTPVSAAGVARRTTVRRSAIYLNTLPAACVRTAINGLVLWRCGGTYYQAYGSRYVVVRVN
jgi:hypothetical protein